MLEIRKALADIKDAASMFKTWGYISYQDVISRYRRTLFGPFWMSAGMVTTSIALALVFSAVYKMTVVSLLPLVIGGFTVFFLVGVPFTDAPELFLTAAGTIKAYPLPYTFHVLRMISRNLIMFGHNLIVYLAVRLICTGNMFVNPEILVGMLIVTVFISSMSLTMGAIGARFKDVRLLVPYVWTIVFYLTPVIWSVSMISEKNRYIYLYNPFYYLLEVIRTPLQGNALDLETVLIALLVTSVSVLVSIVTLARCRKHIALWV